MNFTEFFRALWNREPFPWQLMLADRGAIGDWPEAINLPTASGKTASIDAALFALAAAADLPASEKRMPRRIWFVVDRRIVVDEAFERAKKLAKELSHRTNGPVKEVADRLRAISGTGRPLAVARLRGGTWRDDGWARLPSQPAIICSTVDQVGSALLFRAYGHSDRSASIYAGLAAHDSLILLDEAHCAVPFLQTLRAVAQFRNGPWAAQPLSTPFRFSVMSATPPADIPEEASFPKPAERAAALNHLLLEQRFNARKLATLVRVKGLDDELVAQAAASARKFAEVHGMCRIAVMVNRVATAESIAERLTKESGAFETVLLTGRMRPLDRDILVSWWAPLLKAGATHTPAKPVILVTTQCLEVGADFSFEALVTECASLDALRQRFGRLDRLGAMAESLAVIFVRETDAKAPDAEGDPIYGRAIYETWRWLNEPDQCGTGSTVDFGIEALNARVAALREADPVRFEQLLAPAPDAPVLLPAHLDLLCQTSPRPTPEPDVTLFLHGKERGAPEVRVVLRADLPEAASSPEAEGVWLETLSLLPPTSPEMLTVPLYRFRRWLVEGDTQDPGGDVEGERDIRDERPKTPSQRARVSFLLWRGRDRSELTTDLRRLRHGDVVVIRLTGSGLRGLAQPIAEPEGLGPGRLDLAERSLRQARGRVILRLQRDVLAPLREHSGVRSLLSLTTNPEMDSEEVEADIRTTLEQITGATAVDDASAPMLPGWMKETIAALAGDNFRVEDHPSGGLILTGRKLRRLPDDAGMEDDPFADEEDLTSKSRQPVTVSQHTADVRQAASDFAARCLPPDLVQSFVRAADGHDLGKLDRRFQMLLRNGDEAAVASEPALAKSAWLPEGRRRFREIEQDLRLPRGFRHEFLSLHLADECGVDGDLSKQLIASHHGYARPFAPVVLDSSPLDSADPSLAGMGLDLGLASVARQAWPPAYRLDSGMPERFWRLTRRFGWWGLAYLEAVFRLSDWQASRDPGGGVVAKSAVSQPRGQSESPPSSTLALDAMDGANPLAFLAALGTLRLLARAFPDRDLRLSWSPRFGAWRPLLWSALPLDVESVLSALDEHGLKMEAMFSPELLAASEVAGPKNKKGEAGRKDKLRFPVDAFRTFCEAARELPESAEYSATWAGETAPDEEDLAHRTRFDFTAGQQAFIGMIRNLGKVCSSADLRCSLFDGWRYSSEGVSMRWDTQDEKRQYALQAVDPTNGSKNPPLADVGANFLAIEALPFFPVVPDQWASQPGFDRDAGGRCWRWPIWTHPLSADAIRSLLTLALGDGGEWPPLFRQAIGVSTVFQSGIVQPSGRYRCFTPAQGI